MIIITSCVQAWKAVLDDLGTLGATDQAHGLPVRSDGELWARATWIYNRTAWRGSRMKRRMPSTMFGAVMPLLRRTYDAGNGDVLIAVDALVARLRAMGHHSADVEVTSGGCPALYVGPTWRDRQGDHRYAVVAGPVSFYSEGFCDPFADPADFLVGRDDDGLTEQHQVPAGATVEGIAELIDLQVKVSTAMTAVSRALVGLRRQGIRWGVLLSDDLREALQELEATAVGGDADWRVAVYLYELPEPVDTWAGRIPAGTYLRTVKDKTVRAWVVTGDARGYVAAIEAEYEMDVPDHD